MGMSKSKPCVIDTFHSLRSNSKKVWHQKTYSLSGLPAEILLKIFKFLPDLESVAAFNSTCGQIRRFGVRDAVIFYNALISSIECSELTVQCYNAQVQLHQHHLLRRRRHRLP